MKFVCIWYDMVSEVTRDIIDARNCNEASTKVHLKYNGNDPAPCLSITPLDGYQNKNN